MRAITEEIASLSKPASGWSEETSAVVTPPAAGAATATLDRPTATIEETPHLIGPAPRPDAPEEIDAPRRSGFPWGGTLALIGALSVILSAVLDWGGSFAVTMPRDIAATWLLEPSGTYSAPSLGLVLLLSGTLAALVCLVAMAAPSLTFLRRGLGLLILMIPLAFAFRTMQLGDGVGIADLPNVLGPGALLAAAGALLQLAFGRPRR